jgi:protein-ribulosamine 3-kinase
MTPRYKTVEEALKDLFGEGVFAPSQRPVSGGCINNAAVLKLSNGERVFLKENSATLSGMFAAEVEGLAALFDASKRVDGPAVPRPLAHGIDRNTQFILMEYIEPGRPGPRYAEDFGRAFARLHLDRIESRFGFFGDNFIGATPQVNTWSDDWIFFFGTHRLGYQIETAKKRGILPADLERDVQTLIERLPDFLPQDVQPSLLHGDLWSGNAMADKSGNAVIIDPAAYYGHNEADLAMTELFGRFPSRFYDAYSEVLPIPREYRTERRTIYGLYHILNHLNLFGGGYASQAKSMVREVL